MLHELLQVPELLRLRVFQGGSLQICDTLACCAFLLPPSLSQIRLAPPQSRRTMGARRP
jgi:hypothetical protein